MERRHDVTLCLIHSFFILKGCSATVSSCWLQRQLQLLRLAATGEAFAGYGCCFGCCYGSVCVAKISPDVSIWTRGTSVTDELPMLHRSNISLGSPLKEGRSPEAHPGILSPTYWFHTNLCPAFYFILERISVYKSVEIITIGYILMSLNQDVIWRRSRVTFEV